ncbi:MAG: hypothetical protein ACO3LE_10690, partial [Bdellovibrionota bacterium]
MKVLNLVLIVGVSQVFIACATPRDLEENPAQKSGAESGQVAAPKAKMPVESVQTGLVPQKEEAKSEDLSAFEKEQLKRADEKAKLEEKRHQEKMELEHARMKSFEASQAQFYDYLRDSAEKQQLVQIGMMATLSQLFPKTEAADLSFDEDCFIERIQGLEAALQKAQDQINERNSKKEIAEVLIEVADAPDQVPHLLARRG